MSDDGYYGEYDDFEEGFWDTDPAPDLVDDLAEHAAYSPVWQDDPVGELEPYYSDWEYYSDDYYDDDPVLKHNTLDGSSSTPNKVTTKAGRRGRKRKLDEAREPETVVKRGSLVDCIKGTVWAKEEREKLVSFHLGQHQSVSLLKNWRDLFISDNGTSHTFGKGQLTRDEAWANDLSLADMGLTNEREKPEMQESALLQDGHLGGSDDLEEENPDFDGMDSGTESGQPFGTSEFENNGLHNANHRIPSHSPESNAEYTTDGSSRLRKRRKVAGIPSPPRSSESNGTAASEGSTMAVETTQSSQTFSKHTTHPTKNADGDSSVGEQSSDLTEEKQEPMSRGKKRKLSPELKESVAIHDRDHNVRVKRMAPAKLKQKQDTVEEQVLPVTQLTKSRKK